MFLFISCRGKGQSLKSFQRPFPKGLGPCTYNWAKANGPCQPPFQNKGNKQGKETCPYEKKGMWEHEGRRSSEGGKRPALPTITLSTRHRHTARQAGLGTEANGKPGQAAMQTATPTKPSNPEKVAWHVSFLLGRQARYGYGAEGGSVGMLCQMQCLRLSGQRRQGKCMVCI